MHLTRVTSLSFKCRYPLFFFKEPVLFSGTMRRNMDPFNEHNDLELWNVLDEVSCNTR